MSVLRLVHLFENRVVPRDIPNMQVVHGRVDVQALIEKFDTWIPLAEDLPQARPFQPSAHIQSLVEMFDAWIPLAEDLPLAKVQPLQSSTCPASIPAPTGSTKSTAAPTSAPTATPATAPEPEELKAPFAVAIKTSQQSQDQVFTSTLKPLAQRRGSNFVRLKWLLSLSIKPFELLASPSLKAQSFLSTALCNGLHKKGEATWNEDEIVTTKEETYRQMDNYGVTKLCNVLFTKELARRMESAGIDGVTATACHPGVTASNLATASTSNSGSWLWWFVYKATDLAPRQSCPMGALPTLYAATGSEVGGGDFFGPKHLKMFGYPDTTMEEWDVAQIPSLHGKVAVVTGANSGLGFAEALAKAHECLDLLVNNAGVMGGSYALSVDGYERMFATNHLGHFALTAQLFGMLKRSSAARIVNASNG
eukprot:jgi/Phyca11/21975/fgenesh1_pg.PHYCAscaffold_313_\